MEETEGAGDIFKKWNMETPKSSNGRGNQPQSWAP